MKKPFIIETLLWKSFVLWAFVAASLFAAASPGLTQSATPKETLLVRAERALAERKADAILYQVTDANRAFTNPAQTTRYQWAIDKSRLNQTEHDEIGDQWAVQVYNGKTEQKVTYMQRQKVGGVISQIQTAKTDMYLLRSTNMYEGAYRLDAAWISDLLASGNFTAEPGPFVKPFGQSIKVTGMGPLVKLGDTPIKRSYQMLLAPEKSWMCFQAKVNYPGDTKTIVYDEYGVSQVERHGGVWRPVKVRKATYTKTGTAPHELFAEHILQGAVVKSGDLPNHLFAFTQVKEGNRTLDFDTMRRNKMEKGQMVSLDDKFTKNNGRIWVFILSAGAFVAGSLLIATRFLRRRTAAG